MNKSAVILSSGLKRANLYPGCRSGGNIIGELYNFGKNRNII